MYQCQKAKVEKLCELSDLLSNDFTIAFITSHKEKTRNTGDYSLFSVKSEFYSEELQNKIVGTFKKIGFSVLEFFNEEDFISFAIKLSSVERKKLIVINSAQKGTNIGRKSLIPSFCDLYSIEYIGSNPYVVSLCRDKYRCGNILEQNNIPTPKAWIYSSKYGWLNDSPEKFDKRLIIKPNYESSSIGINKDCIGYYSNSFAQKIHEYSITFKQDIIVEEFISGYEIETPVICTQQPIIFFPIGIEKDGKKAIGEQILDYVTRAENYYSLYNFEEHNKVLSEQLINIARKTVLLLDIRGFGRVDFRIRETGEFFVTDVSTNPHYTEHSSFYVPFKELKMGYEQMIKSLIATVYERISHAEIDFKA